MIQHFSAKDFEGDLNLATTEEFAVRFDGKRGINRVLIATNGIAAVKFIRSIRRWCFQLFSNEKTIFLIVMAVPEDLAANAE